MKQPDWISRLHRIEDRPKLRGTEEKKNRSNLGRKCCLHFRKSSREEEEEREREKMAGQAEMEKESGKKESQERIIKEVERGNLMFPTNSLKLNFFSSRPNTFTISGP